jgi:hypothetical protein
MLEGLSWPSWCEVLVVFRLTCLLLTFCAVKPFPLLQTFCYRVLLGSQTAFDSLKGLSTLLDDLG